MRDDTMVVFNGGFAFELNDRHTATVGAPRLILKPKISIARARSQREKMRRQAQARMRKRPACPTTHSILPPEGFDGSLLFCFAIWHGTWQNWLDGNRGEDG